MQIMKAEGSHSRFARYVAMDCRSTGGLAEKLLAGSARSR